MKKTIYCIMFVGVFICQGWAAYTYEVYTYGGSKTLSDTQSIFIDQQGGMSSLTLYGSASAVIKNTSTLSVGSGGIWYLSPSSSSHLEMSGGQVNQLTMNNDATAVLTGGLIRQIWSYQSVPVTPGRDGGVPIPHIKLYYSGDVPTIQTINSLPFLVGKWGDGTDFSIYLRDVAGYPPVINNIQLIPIPEPATFFLFALSGFLLARKK